MEEEYMFFKPKYGWSYFNVFKYYNKDDCNYLLESDLEKVKSIFRVSYIDPVASMLFNSLIDLLKNHKSTILTFDAEGYEWSLLLNYYDNSVMVLIPEGLLNPFKKEEFFTIDLSHYCFTAKRFAQDWCKCYQQYKKEWNLFDHAEDENYPFDENSHTDLDEKYEELMGLLNE